MYHRGTLRLLGILFFFLAWSFTQLLGCSSSKESRYPKDHARFLRIDSALHTLQKAYVRKDLSAFEDLMLPFDPLKRMVEEVREDFRTFQEIDLTVSTDRIVIDGEIIEMFIHWQGQWKQTPSDTGVRERGHGVLRWVGVQAILLKEVEGDLPFGMANRLALSQPFSRP